MTAASSTARSRRCRERARSGLAALSIEVHLIAVSEMLIDAGVLKQWDAEDHDQVARAIERLLAVLVAERNP
jgi:hypothetical protein